MLETLENSENKVENNENCSIFPQCTQGIKSLKNCTRHYEITQCPFRERMQDYLSRQQETR